MVLPYFSLYISHLIRADSHFVPRNRFQELDIIIIDHYVHIYMIRNFYSTILKVLASVYFFFCLPCLVIFFQYFGIFLLTNVVPKHSARICKIMTCQTQNILTLTTMQHIDTDFPILTLMK